MRISFLLWISDVLVITVPKLADGVDNTLRVNEPKLELITAHLSMKPAKLADIRQTIKLTSGKMIFHRSDFDLRTITKSKLIPQYYKNRPGHLLNFNNVIHLTQPKIHLIKSDYNIRKQGALLNYPNQMSVEDEESYTLVRIPEVFIHNTGQLSTIYSPGKKKSYVLWI